MYATDALRSAIEQLSELLGRAPESVSSLRPTDQGWEADVEVAELERIPETTSVMASYQVVLDPEGSCWRTILHDRMAELCDRYGLTLEDLNLDLGPLGTLLPP
ncbi:gas vesicle protein GvpO [Streptomyces sp. ISL-24]|uniref:gas vesicle protein GvpO n=1 Tax=unclassified Streptomyces TaxID=2593676 RepID=UPI0035ABBC1D